MLEIYGKTYVIDHCVAEFVKEQERKNLEFYITDTLQLIGMNIAAITRGKYISKSWRELCNTNEDHPEKTGDEIAKEVIKKAGLSFGGE